MYSFPSWKLIIGRQSFDGNSGNLFNIDKSSQSPPTWLVSPWSVTFWSFPHSLDLRRVKWTIPLFHHSALLQAITALEEVSICLNISIILSYFLLILPSILFNSCSYTISYSFGDNMAYWFSVAKMLPRIYYNKSRLFNNPFLKYCAIKAIFANKNINPSTSYSYLKCLVK